MCGVWGFLVSDRSSFAITGLKKTLDQFFLLSESRGKEASGLALAGKSTITVLKKAVRAKELIRSKEYGDLLGEFVHDFTTGPVIAIGHARMVTNGSAESHENNQPVISGGVACIHNGIIVNDEELWAAHRELPRKFEVDTEVLLSIVRRGRSNGDSLVNAVIAAFREIQGANTVALMADDAAGLILATTNGSLYYSLSPSGNELVFASEYFILKTVMDSAILRGPFAAADIVQVKPGSGLAIDYQQLNLQPFCLAGSSAVELAASVQRRNIVDIGAGAVDLPRRTSGGYRSSAPSFHNLDGSDREQIARLRRCSRCLLPETFPLIDYDEKGVCNYCHSYKKLVFTGENALLDLAGQKRSKAGRPDCIVALSGGRDSCYGIHYTKTVMGMNPIAYTYDWGMVTDLARRNISRMCGKLGIEHILISADISRKREYIRKNVLAWLKKPDLGTVPLFMAGDKQYFYYANKLVEQYGIDTFVMSENRLERTHFKHGFCGVTHRDSHKRAYDMKIFDTLKLCSYYARQYILNPAYINASLVDTLGGFLSFYLIPHNYLYLYNYLYWDEKKIEETLLGEYDWELATDTKSTWRIGDGTAPFYNYIYYTVAGFTENDTFRSNQIREGILSREKALDAIAEENQPRWDSIQWYCDTISIDFEQTIKTINTIPKLYEGR